MKSSALQRYPHTGNNAAGNNAHLVAEKKCCAAEEEEGTPAPGKCGARSGRGLEGEVEVREGGGERAVIG
jgi:hypothetical protein